MPIRSANRLLLSPCVIGFCEDGYTRRSHRKVRSLICASPSRPVAVVIASRETAQTLLATLDALQCALQPPSLIDVIVNGNPALASQMLPLLRSRQPVQLAASSALRLWTLALGDKANVMNEYLHRIWPGHAPAYFVDGYVRVRADAPALLAQALAADPGALAATGVPGSGRTAAAMRAQMREEGGLHGNFFLLGMPALEALRTMNFRLPVGLYRTDATLGAALSFGLDPSKNGWEPLRFIRVEEQARWNVDAKPWWRLSEIRTRLRRRQRQAQGALENRAVRNLYAERRSAVASLPATVRDLVLGWLAAEAADCHALLGTCWQIRRAFDLMLLSQDGALAEHTPELLFDSDASGAVAAPA